MTKKEPIICAFDTETDYSTDYSIVYAGTRGYVEDERFNCYLCTFANDDFTEAEHPKDIDWFKYQGATFFCHNASFDQRVFGQMQELKIIPPIEVTFICSADMCAYFQLPRSLAGAVKTLFDYDMPKDMRTWMKNRSWQDAVDEGKAKALLKYGIDDAIWTWKLVKELYPLWPELERRLSHMTREMGWEGLPMDTPKLREAEVELEKKAWALRNSLPWIGEVDPDTRKEYATQSKKGLAVYLKQQGLVPPKSLAKDSDECNSWILRHGDKCSYVADMQTLTRITKHLATIRKMLDRTQNGRMSYGLKQYGATATHRWSGESGWNAQNMPRTIKYGVDIRSLIKASDGMEFIVADSAQIEPRTIAKIVGDVDFLTRCSQGQSPYQAHAELTMGWSSGILKEQDPELYALAKTRVLGLGYGSGWAKFLDTITAQGMVSVLDMPYDYKDEKDFLSWLEFVPSQHHYIETYNQADGDDKRHMVNAWVQVMDFRKKNPLIKNAWDAHATAFAKAAGEEREYEIPLLSGRVMKFFNIRSELQGYSCKHAKGDKRRVREYGSSLFQKSVQATARDIFAFQLDLLDQRGIKVVLHVHDEIVAEVPTEKLEESQMIIKECMTTAPPWASDIPLDSSLEVTKTYLK
jgi:DNA polymerase I-like protein with 3'-5' exonuclease and polymerase domains